MSGVRFPPPAPYFPERSQTGAHWGHKFSPCRSLTGPPCVGPAPQPRHRTRRLHSRKAHTPAPPAPSRLCGCSPAGLRARRGSCARPASASGGAGLTKPQNPPCRLLRRRPMTVILLEERPSILDRRRQLRFRCVWTVVLSRGGGCTLRLVASEAERNM